MSDKILSETSLVRYDAMLLAIEQCHKVDEIKELHDKALALELYAKVAMNTDAERKAVEIRIRAERWRVPLAAARAEAFTPSWPVRLPTIDRQSIAPASLHARRNDGKS
jgi:hypothetical protein